MRSPGTVHGALLKCYCQAAGYVACSGATGANAMYSPEAHLAPSCQTCAADDADIASRSSFIIAELKKVQDNLGGGYLSAFPTEHFDRLQNLQPVWAPYYVVSAVLVAAI